MTTSRGESPKANGSVGDAWAFSKAFAGGAWDGAVGAVEGLWSLAKGGYVLTTDADARSRAWDTTQRAAEAMRAYGTESMTDPAKPFRDARDGASALYTAAEEARQKASAEGRSAEFWGHAIGRGGFEVATFLIPIGAAAKAGKAGEVVHAAELAVKAGREIKVVEVVEASTTAAGRVAKIADVPALSVADARFSAVQECAALKAVDKAATARKLDELLAKAPSAKAEIDAIGTLVANQTGGKLAKAPVKSRERALQKAIGDYEGDAAKIKDLARNTIVVPTGTEEQALTVLQRARPDIQAKDIKIVKAAEDRLGYSGTKVNVATESGLSAEIQINSPEMIFAKEKPEDALRILGKEAYAEIASQPGMPSGGEGHALYEKFRTLDPKSAQAEAVAQKSRMYYDAVRRAAGR